MSRALRALRFRLWALRARRRLARAGCRLTLAIDGTPSFHELPDLEIHAGAGRGGSLTLRIGGGVHLGRDLTLDVQPGEHGVVELGPETFFQSRIRLQPWGGAIRLGRGVQIRDACELKAKGELSLGELAMLGRHVTVHCHERVEIGRQAGLAERVTVMDSDHTHDASGDWFLHQPIAAAATTIGANAFVATNAVVLRGARIGRNSVVAAGAVVMAGEHPDGCLLVGAPAQPRKALAGER